MKLDSSTIFTRYTGGCRLPAEPYLFRQWALTDYFVYFSHHLVTIPPCGWIFAAHQNQVPILG